MTPAEAIAHIRERCDLVGCDHITDNFIRTTLRQKLARLHGRLTVRFEDYNVTTAVVTVTDPAAYGWSLPSDFFKLLRVERSLSGNSGVGDWYRLKRCNLRDEANYSFPAIRAMGFPRVYGYVVYNSTLRIVPQSMVTGVYRYLYYPTFSMPADGADIVIGPPGQEWQEWAVLSTCIVVGAAEERDVSVFQAELAPLEADLANEQDDRDAGEAEPPPATDIPWYEREGQGQRGWW